MERKYHSVAMYFVFTMVFFLAFIALTSIHSEAADKLCAGEWNMVANKDFAFILKIHKKGTKIYGSMTRTNGNEPVDRHDAWFSVH